MDKHTIPYRILNHHSGFIQLEVPFLLNRLSWSHIFNNSLPFHIPFGIYDIRLNPIRGKISIEYEPENINILDYIDRMASNPDLKRILGKA